LGSSLQYTVIKNFYSNIEQLRCAVAARWWGRDQRWVYQLQRLDHHWWQQTELCR